MNRGRVHISGNLQLLQLRWQSGFGAVGLVVQLVSFAALGCGSTVAETRASAEVESDAEDEANFLSGVTELIDSPDTIRCSSEGCVGRFADLPRGTLEVTIAVTDPDVAPLPPYYFRLEALSGDAIPLRWDTPPFELELPPDTYSIAVTQTFAHEARRGPYGRWLAARDIIVGPDQTTSVLLENPVITAVTGEVAGDDALLGGLLFVPTGQTPAVVQPDASVESGVFHANVLSGTYDIYFGSGRLHKECRQTVPWPTCRYWRASGYQRVAVATEIRGASLHLTFDSVAVADSEPGTEEQSIMSVRSDLPLDEVCEVVFPDPARWAFGYEMRFVNVDGGHKTLRFPPTLSEPVGDRSSDVRIALPAGKYDVQLRHGDSHISRWWAVGTIEVLGPCR